MQPLTRLHCACAFTDGAKRHAELLDQIEQTPSTSAKIRKLKTSLAALRALHEAHVQEYGPNYARAMVELSKVHHLNPVEAAPLRTSVSGSRELQELREPPKKKTKKQETADKRKHKTRATSAAIRDKKKK